MLVDRVAVRDAGSDPRDASVLAAQAFVLDTTGGDIAVRRDRAVRRGAPQRATIRARCAAERVIAALAEVAYETPAIAARRRARAAGALDARPHDDEHASSRRCATSRSCKPRHARRPLRDDLQRAGARRQRPSAGSRPRRPRRAPSTRGEYDATADRRLAATGPSSARAIPVVVAARAALLSRCRPTSRPSERTRTLAQIDEAVALVHERHHDRRRSASRSRRGAADGAAELREQLEPARDGDGARAPREREAAVPERRRPGRDAEAGEQHDPRSRSRRARRARSR